MTIETGFGPGNHCVFRKFVHVLERMGLAMAGGLCGLFVAAPMAKADIDMLSSVALVFGMVVYGGVGFYLGIDMPTVPPGSRVDAAANVAEMLGAIGTFVAAATALVSVYVLIFDEMPPAIWSITFGVMWLSGVSMQVIAGFTARMCRSDDYPR